MTTYVTVFPYSYKWHSHSVQYTSCATSESTHKADAELLQGCVSWPYAGCWGLTFMCWGCPNRPIRCFCFRCSVIWRRQRRQILRKKTSQNIHLLALVSSFCCIHGQLVWSIALIDSFFSCHFIEAKPNAAQSVHGAELKHILLKSCQSCHTQPLCLLTKAAEYELLKVKLSQKKFWRSSKAHES